VTRRVVIPVALLGVLATAAPAAAQQPFDARARERDALAAAGQTARRPTTEMRRARSALERSLGDDAVFEVDPLTGTPRLLARLDGALAGPRRGDPAEIAQRYVRETLGALGLTEADLGSLGALRRVPVAGGVQVRWRQFDDGVPALDNELRVTVADDGAVVSVAGTPQHDLEAAAEPRLDARAALRVAGGDSQVASAAPGPRRTTQFAGGDSASLVVFGEGDRARLAWRVIHRESSQAVYDVVVDAASGRVLRRVNRVTAVQVFERHPVVNGATAGYDFVAEGWLPAAETQALKGPNAHAWADLDDSAAPVAGPGEEVPPGEYGFDGIIGVPGCTEALPCTWDSGISGSWEDRLRQTTQQTFFYVNRFHDWLRDEVGFTTGSFENDDPVLVQTLDGADGPGGLPDPDHRNNANMLTPPDGQPAVMQMYLFDTRDVHGGDDAAIVYHEYTHGLTNRLVTDGDGWGALTSPQAAAMGEGFSDFFAMDFLVAQGYEEDGVADGDVDVGEYTDGGGGHIREQAIDCPVGTPAERCGDGGFTYGDFGTIAGEPEVHADGEIWAQTLWDLRTALGAVAARSLIFDALTLVPPEPSFLDMRNAILLADGGSHRDDIWGVFAARGMGYFAGTTGSSDVNPAESMATAPPDGGPTGAVSGRAIDADNGRPLAGAGVRVGGHDTLDGDGEPFDDRFLTQTGPDGAFSLAELPLGTHEEVTVSAASGHDPETLRDVVAPSSGHEVRLKRNWAAAAGGAQITSVTGVGTEFAGCQPEQAIDQQPGTGFSAAQDASAPAIVIRLPRLVSVTGIAADPGNTCGDPAGSSTTRFDVAFSEDGVTWNVPTQHQLGVSAAHVRTQLPAATGAGRVRYVRLRLLETHDPDAPFIDFTDLSVYGNALPIARLAMSASVRTGQAAAFDASGSTDPDGTIARYEWDFDGSGSVDLTTTGATTSYAYTQPGTYGAAVTVVDDRGGRERIGGAITVTAAPTIPPTTPPPPAPPAPPAPTFDAPQILLPSSGSRGRVTLTVRCDAACFGPVRLKVDRRTARRLKVGRTIGSASVRLAQAGERRVTVRLTSKAVRALRRARMRTVRVTLSATVRDIGGRSASASRRVRVRR
jgi:extracellular elastinolytic metalloproteinase